MEPKFLRKGVERLEENHSKYLRGGVEGRGTPCSGDGATPLIRLVAFLSEALPPSPLLSGRRRQWVHRRRNPQLIVTETQEFVCVAGPLGIPIIRKVSGPNTDRFTVLWYLVSLTIRSDVVL